MTTARDHSTLSWVKAAVEELLAQARQDLEAYIEGDGAPQRMQSCAAGLHQVHGTLRMLEIYGAAMLVEEMEQLALALGEESFSRRDEGGEALMLALVRLPDYLEKLAAGGPDIPLVLQPLINDLRTIREVPLLAETALFFPALQDAEVPPEVVGAPNPELPEVARQLRPVYHKAQLIWYRGVTPEQGLRQLQEVIANLRSKAGTVQVYRLLQVAEALVCGLEESSIEAGARVKQLLAKLDRQIKRIIDAGEGGVEEESLSELSKTMLYYLASAESARSEVQAVQRAYRLEQALPNQEILSSVRDELSAPSQEMLKTVFGAVQEDLLKIKDRLDLFMRNRDKRVEDLVALAEPMRTVADTLGMIGQGALRVRLREELENLQQAEAAGQVPDEEVLLGMAGAILFVENSLRSAGEGVAASGRDPALIIPIMRETRAEIMRAKDAIMVFVAEPEDLESVRDVPAWLYNIAGSFRILELPEPAEILDQLSTYLKERVLATGKVPEQGQLEAYADAVSAIEYFAESLVEGRGEAAQAKILDTARAAIERLQAAPSASEAQIPEPTASAAPEPVATEPDTDAEVVDQEILDIFLEEAREEMESIAVNYPRWRGDTADEDALMVLRRSFHTLKGSGRLVGAEAIGEFSWALENLLNRVIDRSVEAGPEVFSLLDVALEVMPTLIEAQEAGQPPEVDVASLSERAFTLARHGHPAEPATPAKATPPTEAPVAEQVDEAPDAADSEVATEFEAKLAEAPDQEPETAARVEVEPVSGEAESDTEFRAIPDQEPEIPASSEAELVSEESEIAPELAAVPDQEPETAVSAEPEAAGGEPEIDEEILEIFMEEAREEVSAIQNNLPRWLDKPGDTESLGAIRRSFHTLKGSGRLVGATAIGEFAWSVENLLNQLLEGKINPSSQLSELLESAAGVLPRLINDQEVGVSAAGDVQPLVDRAFALAAGELPSAPLEVPELAAEPGQEPEVLPVAETEEAAEAETQEVLAAETEEAVAAETTAEPGPEPEVLPVAETEEAAEAETEEVLAAETEEAVAAETTAEPGPEPEVLPVAETEEAAEAEAEEVLAAETEEAAAAETTAEPEPAALRFDIDPTLFEIFEPESRDHLATLAGFVEDCRSGGAHCELSDQVARAFHTLRGSAHMAQVHPMAEVSSAMEAFVNELRAAHLPPSEPVADLVEAAVGMLGRILDCITDPSLDLPDTEAFVARINTLKLGLLAEPAAEAVAEEVPLEVGYFDVGGDPDLVDIFLEEAKDLFESLDNGLRDWRSSPKDSEILADLQRTLHTLKGGARLAGIMPLGDLSHAFETLLTGVVSDEVDPSPAIIDLAQDTSDWMVNQIDEVARYNRVESAESLIAVLESARAGKLAEQTADLAAEPPEETAAAVAVTGEEAFAGKDTGAEAALRRQEQIRVRADLLDMLVNNAGEASIYRARLDQQNNSLGFHLTELEQTVDRLRSQLRQLEIETEAQILFRFERDREEKDLNEEFDPLEMDRFSTMQQLSRSLMETVNDLGNIREVMDDLNRGMETLLLQQSRVSTDLQDGLLRTRMVPFSQVVPRLHRLVRQTGKSEGKLAELDVIGAEEELDRNILERMLAPLEHILRNAISHGIEDKATRRVAGKSETGKVSIYVGREGTDVVLNVADDGAGMNFERIRERAIERGLMKRGADVTDDDIMQFVLAPGFSTASEITQVAGRGVGMDVVASGIKQLGGSLEMESQAGRGTSFTIRLPLTLAISEALLAKTGDEIFAIPYASIEGVVRIPRSDLLEFYRNNSKLYSYAGHDYQVRYLGGMLGTGVAALAEGIRWFPVLLVRSGEHRVAIQVDDLLGNRQIVVKTVGPQLSSIQWITGATILSDGRVALILDLNAMVRLDAAKTIAAAPVPVETTAQDRAVVTVMVVDDSITVRKVTARLLERHNMQVVSAKDGMDAVTKLQERIPDVMLLDIEMPRMDGFEVVRHMRNTAELKNIPVIMITSRSGEKHRQRAMELGVQRYLGKPYQETELLDNIYSVLSELQA